MSKSSDPGGDDASTTAKSAARKARSAAALRANLRRRKAQSRDQVERSEPADDRSVDDARAED